jgi:nitrate reductase beta subunit
MERERQNQYEGINYTSQWNNKKIHASVKPQRGEYIIFTSKICSGYATPTVQSYKNIFKYQIKNIDTIIAFSDGKIQIFTRK